MQRIHPITSESCRSFIGKPVLFFLADGTEISGMLSRIDGGKLFITEQHEMERGAKAVTSKNRAKTKAAKKKAAAVTNARTTNSADPFFAAPVSHAPGAPFSFDMAAVAAMFSLQ